MQRPSTGIAVFAFVLAGVVALTLLGGLLMGAWLLMTTPQLAAQSGPPPAGEVVLVVSYDGMRPELIDDLKDAMENVAEQFCTFDDDARTIPALRGHESYSGIWNEGYVRVTFRPQVDLQAAELSAALDRAVSNFSTSHPCPQFTPAVLHGPSLPDQPGLEER